jgi:uncharacterized membrane protein YsdA (DUF1294 family)/cold shock CspA family protein
MAARINLTPTVSVLTGRIVEWDHGKGYGFVEAGKARVFLHRRDFVEWRKRPEAGDRIEFVMGLDLKGRSCAKSAVHVDGGGRITVVNVLVLLGLLALPVVAVTRRVPDLRWAGGYVLVMGALTWWAYMRDKRKAATGQWRISEARLHLLELLGGWPTAFLAQRRLRHKISKAEYQFLFWLIVLVYQLAAFDSLQDWRMSEALLKRIEASSEHHRR